MPKGRTTRNQGSGAVIRTGRDMSGWNDWSGFARPRVNRRKNIQNNNRRLGPYRRESN